MYSSKIRLYRALGSSSFAQGWTFVWKLLFPRKTIPKLPEILVFFPRAENFSHEREKEGKYWKSTSNNWMKMNVRAHTTLNVIGLVCYFNKCVIKTKYGSVHRYFGRWILWVRLAARQLRKFSECLKCSIVRINITFHILICSHHFFYSIQLKSIVNISYTTLEIRHIKRIHRVWNSFTLNIKSQ